MRTIRTPYGRQTYQIPDDGGHLIQEAIHMADGKMRVFRYEFPPLGGNNRVRVESRYLDETTQEELVEQLPDRHIKDFLVGVPAPSAKKDMAGVEDFFTFNPIRDFFKVPEYKLFSEKIKERPMSFFVGQRVEFADRNRNAVVKGTILDHVSASDGYAICVDQLHGSYEFLENILGPGFGVIVDSGNIEPVHPKSQWSTSNWHKNAPTTLAVHFGKDTRFDGVVFSTRDVGRIMGPGQHSGQVSVMWMNKRSEHFNTHQFAGLAEKVPNCYYVPINQLRLCAVNPNTWEILHSFGPLGPPTQIFKAGDILVYNSDKGIRAPTKDSKIVNVGRGAIIQVSQDDGGSVMGHLVGGCIPEMLGSAIGIDRRLLETFPHPWVPQGAEVSITAEIHFRKNPLLGKKGRVLLATDAEGDVGIEFPEDIGAGSLDGEGKDGHCLYLPASALKISE